MKNFQVDDKLHEDVKSLSGQLGMSIQEYVSVVLEYQNMILSQAFLKKAVKKDSVIAKNEDLQETVDNQKLQINNLLKRIEFLKKK
jgi:negative regulator of replication initiation